MDVVVVFGGRSGEHEVSVVSARAVLAALDELGHRPICVGITRDGRWVRAEPLGYDRVPDTAAECGVDVVREGRVVFPVLHGPNGEDGALQGMFDVIGVPYVGSGVEGSAVGINKALQKRVFRQGGLPVVDFVDFTWDDWSSAQSDLTDRIAALGYPAFAKPARLGSSVGITKVHDATELEGAVKRAFRHDDLVIVEAQGGGREVEVAALDGPPLDLSVIGEIVPGAEFYDYRAKYLEDSGTDLRVPADLPSHVADELHRIARSAFRLAGCDGLARIDFFYDEASQELMLNELNTMPGLTPVSMYPMLWKASGVPFADVVQRLLENAIARALRRAELEASRAAAHDDEIRGG